jgi:hypothetical protein
VHKCAEFENNWLLSKKSEFWVATSKRRRRAILDVLPWLSFEAMHQNSGSEELQEKPNTNNAVMRLNKKYASEPLATELCLDSPIACFYKHCIDVIRNQLDFHRLDRAVNCAASHYVVTGCDSLRNADATKASVRALVYIHFVVALAQFIVILFYPKIPAKILAVCIVFVFHLRFTIEMVTTLTKRHKLYMVALRQMVVLYISGQIFITMAIIMSKNIGGVPSEGVISSVIVFALSFLSMICLNNTPILPSLFARAVGNDELYSTEKAVGSKLAQVLNVMFSAALAILLASDCWNIYKDNWLITLVRLIPKVSVVLFVTYIWLTFCPTYSIAQWRRILKNVLIPAVILLLFATVCINFFSNSPATA